MPKTANTSILTIRRRTWRRLTIIGGLFAAAYVILPQLTTFSDSFHAVARADTAYFVWAIAISATTYLASAGALRLLAYFDPPYWRTVLVQFADGFTNRLLPAGLGGIATNALYLIKQSGGQKRAGYIAAINNILGFAGHLIILVVLLVATPETLKSMLVIHVNKSDALVAAVVAMMLLIIWLSWRRLRSVTRHSARDVVQVLGTVIKRPVKAVLALLLSMSVTIGYGLVLYATCLALNVHLPILSVFLVLTASVAVKSITPTPDGIIGVEAGLVAALAAFGIPAGQALSVTIVYRFITYWLPILPGFACSELVLKKRWLSGL